MGRNADLGALGWVRVGTLCQGTRHYRLALPGNLQFEVVHVHLKGFIPGGQFVNIGLDDFHSRKKSYRVGISSLRR